MRVCALALLAGVALLAPAGRAMADPPPPNSTAARVGQLSPDEARRAERARQRAAQRAATHDSRAEKPSAPETPRKLSRADRTRDHVEEAAERPKLQSRRHAVTHRLPSAPKVAVDGEDHGNDDRTVRRERRAARSVMRRDMVRRDGTRDPRVGDRVPDDVPLYAHPPLDDRGPVYERPGLGFGVIMGFGGPHGPDPDEFDGPPPPRGPHARFYEEDDGYH